MEKEPAFAAYRISFMWYSFIACFITILVGLIVSFLTKCVSSTLPVGTLLKTRASCVSKEQGKELVFLPLRGEKNGKASHAYLPVGRDDEPKLIEKREKVPQIL